MGGAISSEFDSGIVPGYVIVKGLVIKVDTVFGGGVS